MLIINAPEGVLLSKQLVSSLVSSQCLKPILQWAETFIKQRMASSQNHSAQKEMQESKPVKNRKSLRLVGWWWDELTLNEVRVENVIYQKEYDITQPCKNHKRRSVFTSSYAYLHLFLRDTQQMRRQERGGPFLRKSTFFNSWPQVLSLHNVHSYACA